MGSKAKFLLATPSELSDGTRSAMTRQVMSDDDPEFVALYQKTTDDLKRILQTQNDVIIMHGEAILGLEAALIGLMEEGEKCLVLVSGSFGDGFVDWVRFFGGQPVEVRVSYNEAIDPADVEAALKQHPDIKLMFMVHCETLSGTLNPARDICTLTRQHGVVSVVDAVTSVGSVETPVDEAGIDVCIVGSQKCFGAPPGLSLLSVSDAAWDKMRAKSKPVRYSYLSMLDWKERWLDGGRFPYTPSISDVYGLSAALDQLLAEGLERVIARHQAAARVCRQGFKGAGLELWPASEEIAATSVTVARLPEGVPGTELRNHMQETYGVSVIPGFAKMKDQLLGVAHMGRTANPMSVVVALAALERSLADLGCASDLGTGVAAALKAI
jgi:pyridoxamine--pyruvate transaminase